MDLHYSERLGIVVKVSFNPCHEVVWAMADWCLMGPSEEFTEFL